MSPPQLDGSGWLGAELRDESEWIAPVDDEVRSALLDHVTAPDPTGTVDLDRLRAVPAIESAIAEIRHSLIDGRGFVLIRGLPVDELDDPGRALLVTTIGRLIGVPIRQNAAGDQLIRVRDEGKDFSQQGVRSYETAAPLPYHSDSSDVVGLYCVRAAQSGGASTIISSVAVHDAMVRSHPDLAELLHEPWPTASIVEGTVVDMPICASDDAGRVFTRYGRKYVETAHEYDATVEPLNADQIAALDLYDSHLADPSFVLDMHFQPGDLQLLNNYRIMHGRAPYVDWPEPEQRRELLRIWLVVEQMELPAVFEDSGFVPRSEALG